MKNMLFLMAAVAVTLCLEAKSFEPSDALIAALISVESKGDDAARGDLNLSQKAYGCLQIRQPVCDDVNRKFGTHYRAEDCLGNRELSMEICRKYLPIYAKTCANEELARIWNGGPKGPKKQSTEAYWTRVRKALAKQS